MCLTFCCIFADDVWRRCCVPKYEKYEAPKCPEKFVWTDSCCEQSHQGEKFDGKDKYDGGKDDAYDDGKYDDDKYDDDKYDEDKYTGKYDDKDGDDQKWSGDNY